MTLLASTSLMSTQSEAPRTHSPFLTVRLLWAVAQFIDAHPWVAFTAVNFAFGWGRISSIASRHLDHDELFTFYIAQAPTIRELIKLTHTIDLHPPLSYLIVRTSFAIFGISPWSCRLPFLFAFLGTAALLFLFLARTLSPVHGLMGVLFLWSTPYAHLANEARPYAMLLCFTTLLLVSWYRIIESDDFRNNHWALAIATLSGFGLLLSHVLGVLSYAAFFCAEVVRFWIRRKPDWRLWLAFLAPSVSILAYLPLIRLRLNMNFAKEYQVSPRRLADCYWEGLRYLITPWVVIALITLAWSFLLKRRSSDPLLIAPAVGAPFRTLLLFLFVVPLEVCILFLPSGTPFYERYGAVFLIPCIVFPTLFLGYRTQCNRLVASGMALLLGTLFIFNSSGRPWLTEQLSLLAPPRVAAKLLYFMSLPPVGPPPMEIPVPAYLEKDLYSAPRVTQLDALDPGLPLVAGNGPTFLELDQYQDEGLRERLYLLTDQGRNSAIVHASLSDHYAAVKAAFPVRGEVKPYCSFLSEHPDFMVLGGYNHPDTWLLKQLEMDGATLTIVGTYEDGIIEEHQVYRVHLANRKCYGQTNSETRGSDKSESSN